MWSKGGCLYVPYTSGHLISVYNSISAGVGDLPYFPVFLLFDLKITNFFLLVCLLFCNTTMTTESTCSYHVTRKNDTRHSCVWTRTPKITRIMYWKVRWPLRFVCSYSNTQETSLHEYSKCRQKTQKEAIMCALIINYALKSEGAIALCL